jgi:uncharacterized protein (TIGR01319 family)
MSVIRLIDFGSTYTKVTAIDVENACLLGTAAAHTSIQTDIKEGLAAAMTSLEEKIGSLHYEESFACSSAAGGLRMIASGLVPALTEKAARMACFGAGAKVIKSYSYELTEEDVEEISQLKPDILLLVGGTDGGNKKNIIHNAGLLAKAAGEFPIIYAGNRNAASQCRELLSHWEVHTCPNVMPTLDSLKIEPVQEKIRQLFLERIIQAKGLGHLDLGEIIPTPAAMLRAMELLATEMGELMAVDLGGATTDIYSIAKGEPSEDVLTVKGLPEPYAKRTVEGDLGMRYSIHGIVDLLGVEALARKASLSPEFVAGKIQELYAHPDRLPKTPEMKKLDQVLAVTAVSAAINRHVGRLEEVYTPLGKTYAQTGKDLREVKTMVLTGGSLIKNPNPYLAEILDPGPYLKPRHAKFYVDQHYILASMGLLADKYPDVAVRIMKKELASHELEK